MSVPCQSELWLIVRGAEKEVALSCKRLSLCGDVYHHMDIFNIYVFMQLPHYPSHCLHPRFKSLLEVPQKLLVGYH